MQTSGSRVRSNEDAYGAAGSDRPPFLSMEKGRICSPAFLNMGHFPAEACGSVPGGLPFPTFEHPARVREARAGGIKFFVFKLTLNFIFFIAQKKV